MHIAQGTDRRLLEDCGPSVSQRFAGTLHRIGALRLMDAGSLAPHSVNQTSSVSNVSGCI